MTIDNTKASIGTQINIGKTRIDGSLTDEQFDYLSNQLSDLFNNRKDQDRVIQNHLDLIDVKNKTILDLEKEVQENKSRIKAILADEEISEEVKALVAHGRLKDAEELVDRRYEEQDKQQEQILALLSDN